MRILIFVLGGVLALTIWGAAANFPRLNWHMSIHGWIAMALGVVLSLGLGGGLMALSFYSDRRGYDDNVAREAREDEAPGHAPDDHVGEKR